MIGHGYSRSDCDNCMHHRKLSYGSFVYFLLYVDDLLIISKEPSLNIQVEDSI